MKKIIIIIAVFAVGILGWFALSSRVDEAVTVGSKPWIEVDNKNVNVVNEGGTVVRALASGDELDAGMIIKTDATGAGTVYFSDGSNLRIDPNTTVKITEAEFDENSGSLKVRVALSVGKVWSKITTLATPESHWEVRTGSAVATVRGSAFGTEVTAEGETNIIGSEHDIAVTAIIEINEETGEEVLGDEVIMGESEVLVVTRERKLEKRDRASVTEDEQHPLRNWIRENETRDGIIRDKIEELRAEGLVGEDLRIELREVIKTELQEEFEAKVEEISERTGLPESEVEAKLETRIETKIETKVETRTGTTQTGTTQTGTTQTEPEAARPTVTSLEVSTRAGLKVSEGAMIEFEAIAILSDGTKKVVTDLVSWQVVGSIGGIIKPGIFQARLGADVSEIGTAFGAVTASFKSDSGKEFGGKSGIITVVGAVTPIDERG